MTRPACRGLSLLFAASLLVPVLGCSSSRVKAVSDKDFEKEVLASEGPVLVDFWAVWCGPCRIMAPVLDQVAEETEGKIRVLKMDVDKNPSVPGRYGIQGIPTLILFEGGKALTRFVGVVAKNDLMKGIEEALERAKRPDLIVVVDSDNFETEVLRSKVPVLVDFWAVWCGPCRKLVPLVEDLSWEYEGRLKVAKIDFDTNKDLATRYHVQAIPNVLIFKGGRPVRQWTGVMPKENYVEAIDRLVPPAPAGKETPSNR